MNARGSAHRILTLSLGLVAKASLIAALGCRASTTAPTAGFWFGAVTFALPIDVTTKLGGPLSEPDIELIRTISRAEVERAFADFRIAVVNSRDAFWRVEVVQTLGGRQRRELPNAGESLALGPLGGSGAVSFLLVALKAIQYAPTAATRQTMIEGIGRGIGRVAAHEFAHQILGAHAVHNANDESSYEYPSPDRAAQYYGELRWTIVQPLLQEKLGSRVDR